MSRQQDTVIDDDEESCPLCIEEFDLSDKNFRPCPCGYQICQFCFNSLKNTYEKSTCPNCRRPYDEKTIQYKIPTAEEFKADQANKNKRQVAAKRKETEKKEVEASSRRNLAGVRVKQQNLVYVIGLVPQIKDEQALLQTLRGPEYFGQYGDIDKIVVSKAKPGAANSGVGVYVTYARKEDAALCISTIDGSVNGDRVLRAQFGTTKYCSAFLRGETCTNKNCSFLHETGEDGHSSSLQGEVHNKKPTPAPAGMAPPPRPLSTAQSISSQPMARQGSKDSDDRKGSTDGSALPSTASWAAAAPPKTTRRSSYTTSRATPSPQFTHTTLAPQRVESKSKELPAAKTSKSLENEQSTSKAESSTLASRSQLPSKPFDPVQSVFDSVLRSVSSHEFQFVFSDSCLSEEQREEIENFPVMIDPYGGAKRRIMQDKEAIERARLEADAKIKLEAQATSAAEEALDDENMLAGSLALGGEPEDNPRSTSARGAIGRPSQGASATDQFASMNLRSLTPQQRQQLGLGSGNVQQAPGLPQPPPGSTAFEMSDFDRRPATFSQAQYDQISNHQRHGSRYFNSESKSSTANRFQGQQQSFYSSGVQGPPPGLPASGTPPVSGGGMFAHGNNFSNSGFGAAKDANTDLAIRGRGGTNAGPDVSKRGGVEHLADPSIVQARLHQSNHTGQGLFGGNQGGYQQSNLMYGGGGGGYNLDEKNFPPLPLRSETQSALHSRFSSFHSLPGSKERSSTPKVPPGFETVHAHPEPSRTQESTSSQAPTQQSATAPVLPAAPALPVKPRAPSKEVEQVSSAKPRDTSNGGDLETIPESKKIATEISLGSPKPKTARSTNQQMKNEKQILQGKPQEETVAAAPSSSKTSQPKVKETKRAQKPGKIDIPPGISAAAAGSTSANVSSNGKPATPVTSGIVATPPLMSPRPTTPATATSEVSFASAPRPRTLRVTTGAPQKTATETALPSATTEQSASTFPLPTASGSYPKPGFASRQMSISSTAKVDSHSQSQSRPSTPAMSERLASEGVSRASSPPPSIVGSAPERTKTKNQLKKDRRDKAKTQNKSIDSTKDVQSPATVVPVAEAVGPILARQKKQKRGKPQPIDTATEKGEPFEEKPVEEEGAADDTQATTEDTSKPESMPETPIEEDPPMEEQPSADNEPSYTLRDLYADAAKVKPEARDKVNMIRIMLQHKIPQSSVPKMFSSMLASGDLSKDHPWLNPNGYSFNSPAYKLPSDNRKGQEYLDAHDYVGGSYAFGHVYLPIKEKKALERGTAVGIAGTATAKPDSTNNGKSYSKKAQNQNDQEDLLKRCLITPSGTVYRHLTTPEADKVLELEQRRQWYTEEFGEDIGGMHALDNPLEMYDYINVSGGMEELGKNGERHGVVWVRGGNGGAGEDEDEGEGKTIDDEDEEGMMSDETDDLGIELDPSTSMPGGWGTSPQPGLLALVPPGLPSLGTTGTPGQQQQPPNTLAPIRTQPPAPQNINLRALDLESLQKRVTEKQKELEAARKEMDRMEKSMGKRNREFAKWREGVLKA